MNANYIKQHARFGRSRQHIFNPVATVYFGARRSSQFIRCYPKAEIGGFRIELQLNSGFLRKHGLYYVADLVRLPDLLIGRHIQFVALDCKRLTEYFNRRGQPVPHVLQRDMWKDVGLQQSLRILSSEYGAKNLHRFLIPLAINRQISAALQAWAVSWNKSE